MKSTLTDMWSFSDTHGLQNTDRMSHIQRQGKWRKLVQEKQSFRPYLFSQLCQGFSPREICEPVVDRALWPRRDQREVILLVDLWLAPACVRERVVAQFLCDDAAEVGADLKRWWSRRWGEGSGRHAKSSRHWLHTQGFIGYLWGVEVDIFSTAVFIARHCWLVVESLLHIECRQLILKLERQVRFRRKEGNMSNERKHACEMKNLSLQ